MISYPITGPIVVDFSQAVSNVSIQFGDFDADNDYEVIMGYSGLDGTGSNLGTNSVFYSASENIANGDSAVATLALSGSGVKSVLITSPYDATNNPYPFSI